MRVALLVAVALLAAVDPMAAQPRVVDVGRHDFVGPGEGLSGLARVEGDRYLAVSDADATLHPLEIAVDPATGEIRSAALGEPLRLADAWGAPVNDAARAKDREDLALDPATDGVWIANEWSEADRGRPSIARHDLATGRRTELVTATGPLAVYAAIRPNQGFESLARRPDGSETWTANEQALRIDGDAPSVEAGALVRLQRFDGEMRPLDQYAYRTDPLPETTPEIALRRQTSGVVGLLVLPAGGLLAMERAITGNAAGFPVFRVRLYAIDFEGATDVSRPPWSDGLARAARPFTPVDKRLLFELEVPVLANANFEGIAWGPRLANGDRSILLIADNGSGTHQALHALRWVAPAREP